MEHPQRRASDPTDGERLPPLYARVGYDARLEAEALARLDARDPADCRRIFAKLLQSIDFASLDGDCEALVQLLADVLQKVNRRVLGTPQHDAACQRRRIELIETFARLDGPAQARDRFLPALDRLLEPLRAERPRTHPLVERAKVHIGERYTRRLSLSRVAEALAVSPNYLSRLFRRETGLTLTAYIQRARLKQAKRLLADGERSISEIAYQVGYQNYRDFYRNFVKYEHHSPRRMRQILNEDRRG
jgi:AraC-like DNA-binding protein